MDLKETLIKMKNTAKTDKDFSIMVESMKRRASKGMISGITESDIDSIAHELENIDEAKTVDNTDSVDAILTELDAANNYVDGYLDTLSEDQLSHLLAEEYCNIINEGPILNTIKDVGGKIVGGIKKGISNVGNALNPATGSAFGPAIGAAAALGVGGATVGAILARLRRRKKRNELSESFRYFNNSDIELISERCNFDDAEMNYLLNCDNDISILTEEIINYYEDTIVENYLETLTDDEMDTIYESLIKEYPDESKILTEEKHEIFYHTRRYNQAMDDAYDEHPVRTAAAVGGVGAGLAGGTFLATDAIIKNQQNNNLAKKIADSAVRAIPGNTHRPHISEIGPSPNIPRPNPPIKQALTGEIVKFTPQEPIINKIGRGISTGVTKLWNNNLARGIILGGGVALSSMLIAKLIKKIAAKRKAAKEQNYVMSESIDTTNVPIKEYDFDKPIGEILMEELNG